MQEATKTFYFEAVKENQQQDGHGHAHRCIQVSCWNNFVVRYMHAKAFNEMIYTQNPIHRD